MQHYFSIKIYSILHLLNYSFFSLGKNIIYYNRYYLIKRNWEADQLKKAIIAIMICMLLFVTVPAVTATGNFGVYTPTKATTGILWSDNFDSYALGTDLHGVGGWKGWDNDPTWTAYVSDTQAQSTPHSVEIAGDSDLVHEYGYTTGNYTFKTYVYIPTDFVGQSYFIMLSDYTDGGGAANQRQHQAAGFNFRAKAGKSFGNCHR